MQLLQDFIYEINKELKLIIFYHVLFIIFHLALFKWLKDFRIFVPQFL